MVINAITHIETEDLIAFSQAIVSHQFNQLSLGQWRKSEFSATDIKIKQIYIQDNLIDLGLQCNIISTKLNEPPTDVGTMEIKASISIQLNNISQIQSKISIDTLKWIKGPKLDLGLFEISLKALTNSLLSLFNQTMEQKISGALAQLMTNGVQSAVADLRDTNASIRIHEEMFLSIIPTRIYIKPYTKDEHQIISLQLQGDYVLSEEQKTLPGDWAPQVSFSNFPVETDTQFDIQISHDQLGLIIKQELIGKTAHLKGKQISVHNFQYDFANQNHIVELDFKGDVSAKLNAQFQIAFDQDLQLFQLVLKEINLKPKSWFHRFIVKAFKKRIIREIETRGRVKLDRLLLSRLNFNFDQFLKSKLLDLGILPRGEISRLMVKDFTINNDGIHAELHATIDINTQLISTEKILRLYKERVQ